MSNGHGPRWMAAAKADTTTPSALSSRWSLVGTLQRAPSTRICSGPPVEIRAPPMFASASSPTSGRRGTTSNGLTLSPASGSAPESPLAVPHDIRSPALMITANNRLICISLVGSARESHPMTRRSTRHSGSPREGATSTTNPSRFHRTAPHRRYEAVRRRPGSAPIARPATSGWTRGVTRPGWRGQPHSQVRCLFGCQLLPRERPCTACKRASLGRERGKVEDQATSSNVRQSATR
jgi:hypothetical protein